MTNTASGFHPIATPTTTDGIEDSILISQAEACRLLGIERTTLWRLVTAGEIDQIKIGTRALVLRESLNKFVSRRTAMTASHR